MPFDMTPTDIHTQRLTRLAEFFENGAAGYDLHMGIGFAFPNGQLESALDASCGTIGCIAGYAMTMAHRDGKMDITPYTHGFTETTEVVGWKTIRKTAMKYLGLTHLQAEDLFEGFGTAEGITPAAAAVAIRNVMAGRAAWK